MVEPSLWYLAETDSNWKILLSDLNVLLKIESTLSVHGPRSLVGYRPWGPKESDTTEQLHFHFQHLHR